MPTATSHGTEHKMTAMRLPAPYRQVELGSITATLHKTKPNPQTSWLEVPKLGPDWELDAYVATSVTVQIEGQTSVLTNTFGDLQVRDERLCVLSATKFECTLYDLDGVELRVHGGVCQVRGAKLRVVRDQLFPWVFWIFRTKRDTNIKIHVEQKSKLTEVTLPKGAFCCDEEEDALFYEVRVEAEFDEEKAHESLCEPCHGECDLQDLLALSKYSHVTQTLRESLTVRFEAVREIEWVTCNLAWFGRCWAKGFGSITERWVSEYASETVYTETWSILTNRIVRGIEALRPDAYGKLPSATVTPAAVSALTSQYLAPLGDFIEQRWLPMVSAAASLGGGVSLEESLVVVQRYVAAVKLEVERVVSKMDPDYVEKF